MKRTFKMKQTTKKQYKNYKKPKKSGKIYMRKRKLQN